MVEIMVVMMVVMRLDFCDGEKYICDNDNNDDGGGDEGGL